MKLSKEMKKWKCRLKILLGVIFVLAAYLICSLLDAHDVFKPADLTYYKNYRVLPNCTSIKHGDCHKPKLWGAG